MADKNINAPKKKKSFAASFFSWFFSLILIAVAAVLVVGIFIAPISKIKVGSFDVAAINISNSTVGEILGDSDITVFELLQAIDKVQTVNDGDITYAPTDADKSSAVAVINGCLPADPSSPDITEEKIGLFVIGVLSGNTPSDTTGVPKVCTFTDKELAYMLNLGLQQILSSAEFGVELNQISITDEDGIKVSTVTTLDISSLTASLPDKIKTFLDFNRLRLFSTYEMSVAGTLVTTSTVMTFGSLDEENSELILKLIKTMAGDDLDLLNSSQLITTFINNLGVIGANVSEPGAGGISAHSVSVIIENTPV